MALAFSWHGGCYWGCGTTINKILWAFFAMCSLAGTILVVNGYVKLKGPHHCFSTRSECTDAGYSKAECQLVHICNGTVLAFDTCTSFIKQWCEDAARPTLNEEMEAGIALLVAGTLIPALLLLFSRPPDNDMLPNHHDSRHTPLASQPSTLSPASSSSVLELKTLPFEAPVPAPAYPPPSATPPAPPPLPPRASRPHLPISTRASSGAPPPHHHPPSRLQPQHSHQAPLQQQQRWLPPIHASSASRKPSRHGKGELLLSHSHTDSAAASAGGVDPSGQSAHGMNTFTIYNPLAHPEWRDDGPNGRAGGGQGGSGSGSRQEDSDDSPTVAGREQQHQHMPAAAAVAAAANQHRQGTPVQQQQQQQRTPKYSHPQAHHV